MKPSSLYLTNSCGTIVLLFQGELYKFTCYRVHLNRLNISISVLLSISFAHELTLHNSSTFDVDATTLSTKLVENGSNPHTSSVAERIARGNAILQEMKSHIFGECCVFKYLAFYLLSFICSFFVFFALYRYWRTSAWIGSDLQLQWCIMRQRVSPFIGGFL